MKHHKLRGYGGKEKALYLVLSVLLFFSFFKQGANIFILYWAIQIIELALLTGQQTTF